MDLVKRLLTVDVKKRLTVDDALKHPWINTVSSELESRNLENTQYELKQFVSKRKFRKVVLGLVAERLFQRNCKDVDVDALIAL